MGKSQVILMMLQGEDKELSNYCFTAFYCLLMNNPMNTEARGILVSNRHLLCELSL